MDEKREKEEAVDPEREDAEPEYDPPKIDCCASAKATGGAYHAPDCPEKHVVAV